jgi:hypothetical protein
MPAAYLSGEMSFWDYLKKYLLIICIVAVAGVAFLVIYLRNRKRNYQSASADTDE